ncbi:hypothetical protein DL93DRAFT_724033 [Clavulina sp. PMI_390]|nr:hypothetical protein DL93DRAFT_724033 [Clavulina sp. PMI_390]
MLNLDTIRVHVSLYGCGLVLHTLWAAHHPESRVTMLEYLQRLVNICALSQEHKQSRLGLVNMVHIMNAARVIGRELRRSEVRENPGLSVSHCLSIESLLDFLDDTVVLLPAWSGVLLPLKEPLIVALNGLST